MNEPLILMIPGVSLLTVTRTPDGTVFIECPACKAAARIEAKPRKDFDHESMVHEDDCPVFAKINAAQDRLAAEIERTVAAIERAARN